MYYRKLFSIFLLHFIFFLNSHAQELSGKLSNRLDNQRAQSPLDKLFLHTDRNLYYPGDTIYFHTYIEDRFTQKIETSSRSSYVLLIGDEGEVIDSARFRINYSMAPGWLAVPQDCKSGWYRIKAFTSQMQNYDPGYAFSSRIRIEELIRENLVFNYRFNKKNYHANDTVEISLELKEQNGEPLKNTSFSYSFLESKQAEETFRARTNRNGTSVIRIFLPDSLKNTGLDIALEKYLGEFHVEIPFPEKNPNIRFLPEGGTFVPGVLQKVAFNAVSQTGKQLFVSGVVKDDLGTFVDSIRSGALGPGMLQFIPQEGRKYFAGLEDYPGQKWPLPGTNNHVPCLKVSSEADKVIVDISGESRQQYFLALSKNKSLVAFTPLNVNGQKRVVFKTDALPPGMASVTLFTSELQPLAERVFFIYPQETSRFNISADNDVYQSGETTNLNVGITSGNKTGSGFFSIAVVDSATALSPQVALQNIRDRFWFAEDFYSRVPFAVKQKGLASLPPDQLDLLLMTYGWTAFKNTDAEKTPKKKEQYYDQYDIEIANVLSSRKSAKIANSQNPLFVLSLEEPSMISLIPKTEDSYLLDVDSIPPFTQSIMIVPNFMVKRKINAVNLKPVINESFIESVKNTPEKKEVFLSTPSGLISEPSINLDSFRVLKEIVVYARREPAKKYVNEYQERYKGVQTLTLSELQMETAANFEDLLRRLHPYLLDTNGKRIYFNPAKSIINNAPTKPTGALFVVDGIPLDQDYSSLVNMKPSDIHSVTALKRVSGYYLYGEVANEGVVFIETKLNHSGEEYVLSSATTTNGSDLRKIIQLFRADQEFYTPPQEAVSNDPELWIRPTLYWNSEVFYDGENPVAIQYPNHKKAGTVFIIVNGVTTDGMPLSGIHKYEIK